MSKNANLADGSTLPTEKTKRAKRSKAGYIPPWFRLYHEILDDPKLCRLPEAMRWRFIGVLGMNHRRQVPCDDAAAAVTMRISQREARDTRIRFSKLGLVNAKWISPSYARRQFLETDHSTIRSRLHRKKKKSEGNVARNVARNVASNGNATPPETESESESEKKDSPLRGAPVRPGPDSGAVMRVFDHWRCTFNHPKAKLDAKRGRLIAAALDIYSEEDLCRSIDGYLLSPHHCGQNDKRTRYDDIEIFLRDAKHVEAGLQFGLGAANGKPPLASMTGADREQLAKFVESRRASGARSVDEIIRSIPESLRKEGWEKEVKNSYGTLQ